ncbi:hypothetical protein FQA39_LY05027 [Lamprigera yunnana]|nr:hypothetical protein FQA39_LY05027 [Lamprigera yunnana]
MEGEEKIRNDKNKGKLSGSSDEKDEKAPDSSENNGVTKSKTGKPKKRKKPKDITAPRQPLTGLYIDIRMSIKCITVLGYVRYLNDRRESVRAANPNLPFAEITRILASEWTNLPADKKQAYLDAAVLDKERYNKEYSAYKQTQAYKSYTKQVSEKKFKENKDDPKVTSIIPKESHNELDMGNFDIPIFTEEFLDHNKTRDAELRQLRKSNTDYEQQNSILQKHIENVKGAIEKLEVEILQQRKNNKTLQQHLDHLRSTLTNGFANVKLPGTNELPSLHSIDTYMCNLHTILLENSSQDAQFLQMVRDKVACLEFNG